MIETERLILRPWREEDVDPFTAIVAEPDVLEWFTPRTRDENVERMAHWNDFIARNGYGRMAVARRSDEALLGLTGIQSAFETLPIAGRPEIVWLLTNSVHGQGFATEAARGAIADGFARGLTEVLARVHPENFRSQNVARKAGMIRTPELDFDDPDRPPGHRLRPSILFRITRP